MSWNKYLMGPLLSDARLSHLEGLVCGSSFLPVWCLLFLQVPQGPELCLSGQGGPPESHQPRHPAALLLRALHGVQRHLRVLRRLRGPGAARRHQRHVPGTNVPPADCIGFKLGNNKT